MKIGHKQIGEGDPCLVIAEVGLAHDGSVRIAHDFIDAIAKAGADAVKFQCHLGDETDEWRVKPRWPFESRQEFWKRTDFSREEWKGLKVHADEVGLEFLCSPFSVEAVKLLDPLVPAWKIPSGQITNEELLEAVAKTGKPILISTGMATEGEIGRAKLLTYGTPTIPMRCVSLYPCPAEKTDLSKTMVGFSDHSGTIYAGLAAVTLGCDVLEVHAKLSEHDQGPDASSSLTVQKLTELVEGIRFIEKAKANPVNKDEMAKELEPVRRIFMRQPVA